MGTMLTILDIAVVLLVVFTVARAVWKGPAGITSPLLLSFLILLCLCVFGMVSLCGADNLTTNSSFNQTALLIALVTITLATCGAKPKKAR